MPQIDALTLDDLGDLLEHWSEAPPLAECVRAWLGVKTEKPDAQPEGERSTVDFETMRRALALEQERFGRVTNAGGIGI